MFHPLQFLVHRVVPYGALSPEQFKPAAPAAPDTEVVHTRFRSRDAASSVPESEPLQPLSSFMVLQKLSSDSSPSREDHYQDLAKAGHAPTAAPQGTVDRSLWKRVTHFFSAPDFVPPQASVPPHLRARVAVLKPTDAHASDAMQPPMVHAFSPLQSADTAPLPSQQAAAEGAIPWSIHRPSVPMPPTRCAFSSSDFMQATQQRQILLPVCS
jgi:hypothetical protein